MVSAVALLVYVLTTRVRGVRRAPTAAIAWVMGLVLLPYLFLPLFLLFGIRKLKPASARRVANPSEPAMTRFHANGAEARIALWEVIDSATATLDVCTFLVGDDDLGRAVVKRLLQRAREGVR